jgi:hypothetical protein
MGFRYRKSFKAGPFRATVSKSGVSYSVGAKGARITKLANGKVQKTVSIPGSGLSYTSTSGGKKKQQAKSAIAKPVTVKALKPPTSVKPVKPVKPAKVKAPTPVWTAQGITTSTYRPVGPSSAVGSGHSTIAAVPTWVPGRIKGYLASFTLNQAGVVIERSSLGRLAGYSAASISWSEIVAISFRDPTFTRNGYVHFVVRNDPSQAAAAWNDNRAVVRGRRPHLVMFTWQQRQRYQWLKATLGSAAPR